MLRPSYSELMEILNNESDVDSQITSRYTIVIAAAKRARQLIEGAEPLVCGPADRAVSMAVKELAEGYLKIRLDVDPADIYGERQTKNYYKVFSAVSKDDLREDFKDKYVPGEIADEEDDADEDAPYDKDEFIEVDEEDDAYVLEEEEADDYGDYDDE